MSKINALISSTLYVKRSNLDIRSCFFWDAGWELPNRSPRRM